MSESFVVNGEITRADEVPLGGFTVRVFDKDLPSLGVRGEQQLGEDTFTDHEGHYKIVFPESDFQQGEFRKRRKAKPDIFIRVYDDDELLGESLVHFNAERETCIDLAVTVPDRSEYEKLFRQITPVLQDVAIADLTDEDLAFLKNEIKNDKVRRGFLSTLTEAIIDEFRTTVDPLMALRRASQFARQTRVSQEVCYAWVRILDPIDLEHLIAKSDHDLRATLERAIQENLISASISRQIDDVIRSLKRYNYVAYTAKGQLIDQATGTAVSQADFILHVFDVNGASGAIDLGIATTDNKGFFVFIYAGPPLPDPPAQTVISLRFLLKIADSKIQPLGDFEVSISLGQKSIFQVTISVPEPIPQSSASIADVLISENASVPPELQKFLTERNINTLSDIRRAGGLSSLEGLPLPADHPAVMALEAHADLSRLSADVFFNSKLIGKGYASVTAIADAPQALFVSAMHEQIGDFKAAQLHVMARAQSAFLDNVLAAAAAAQANGFAADVTVADGTKLFSDSCVCEDCESAVSPAIYLADLLDYATKSITNSGAPVDLSVLSSILHQPFGDLSVSCEAETQPVRRIRICIEVLRAYLGARPLGPLLDPTGTKETDLETTEKSYLVSAYTTLLNLIGTSYEEIRLARTATDEQRQALADRLGIDLTIPRPSAPGDELDRLFLDVSLVLGNPSFLLALEALESDIETLFGLASTKRNPLSDGQGISNAQATLTGWNLVGVEWGRNTDPEGYIYLADAKVPLGFVFGLARDPQFTEPVARGQLISFDPVVSEINSSGLSGSFHFTALSTVDAPINFLGKIAAIPNFLSWRLKHLRTLWRQQDHPTDVYDDVAIPLLPFIDPDLIGPDDFRLPYQKSSASLPNTPFDLWLARRGIVDQMLAKLQKDRETSGLSFILSEVFSPLNLPVPNFDGWLDDLTQGDKVAVAEATANIVKINLTVDSFIRLMAIRAKDAETAGGPGEPVSSEEWDELYSILAQVKKIRLFPTWRSEEQQLQTPLILGMQDFWLSLRELIEGDWPLKQQPGIPLIDPDLVTLKDLPESFAGGQAIQLWKDRWLQLKQTIPTELATARTDNGFDAMVFQALGTPPGTPLPVTDNLDTLRTKLASNNSADVSAAQDAITNDLHLALDAFGRLMAIRDKDAVVVPEKKPTAAEYAEVYALLTKARKLKTEYTLWAAEEATAFGQEGNTAGEPIGSLAYWRARKAALPRWRATAEERQAWRQALLVRSALPIIDPDLIDDFDIRDPVSGNVVYDIWNARSTDVAARISAITGAPPTNSGGFDQLLGAPDYLGIGTAALDQLDQERSLGHSIRGRLDQLGLSYASFDTLLRVSKLLTSNQIVLSYEWTDVASILVQCYKQKQFAKWQLEESPLITFGPDFFQVRPLPSDPLVLAPVLELPVFRATYDARHTWDDTLQSRIDQQSAVISAMRDAISATEAATLTPLRDGLMQSTDAPGIQSDLVTKAKWLTQKLLIDFQADTCQSVTRIEQAIETMQSLFYALRAGLGGEQLLPTLALSPWIDLNEFDEKWKWLGSYATWRSAMLVFLYPETLLQPSLRPETWQTSGFRNLVDALATGGTVTPDKACIAAKAYAAYFNDVAGLLVEATCHSVVTKYRNDACCDSQSSQRSEVFFMFARSRWTNRLYWATYDFNAVAQDYAQSFWQEITLDGQHGSADDSLKNVSKLVGASPAFTESGKTFICLFVESDDGQRLKLGLLRLNVDTLAWDFVNPDLKIPFGPSTFMAVMEQDMWAMSAIKYDLHVRPKLGIDIPEQGFFLGTLNFECTDWENEPSFNSPEKHPLAMAVHHPDYNIYNSLVVSQNTMQTPPLEEWSVGGTYSSGSYRYNPQGVYHGMIWLPLSDSMPVTADKGGLVFFVFTDTYWGANQLVTVYVNEPEFEGDAQIDTIICNSGAPLNFPYPDSPSQFVYRRRPDGSYRRATFDWVIDRVYRSSDSPVVPDVTVPISIPCEESGSVLQDRRRQIEQTFNNNSGYPESLITYLEEAYYFVPMHIALQLQQSGEYEAALGWFRTVYDYTARDPNQRKIYYGLKREESLPEIYQWSTNWLSDALNPHAIAKTRRNTYTKYTLFCIIRCLLDYADYEFSQDTGESVVRARILYEDALELLNTDPLNQTMSDCATIIRELAVNNQKSSASGAALVQLRQSLKQISDPARLRHTVTQIVSVLNRDEPECQCFAEAHQLVSDAVVDSSKVCSSSERIERSATMRTQRHLAMITNPDLEKAVAKVGNAAGADLINAVSRSTGLAKENLEGNPIDLPWLRETNPSSVLATTTTQNPRASMLAILQSSQSGYVPSTIGLWGCIPRHPILSNLHLHAEVNLRKLRTCRNFAGMKRDLDFYAAPTNTTSALPSIGVGGQLSLPGNALIQPTLYYYSVLIDRAKQLVQIATQIESQMLSALEKYDDQSYGILRALQDLNVTAASVQLQILKVSQAKDSVKLAGSLQDRANAQSSHFSELLAKPNSEMEDQALFDLDHAAHLQDEASNMAFQSGIGFGFPLSIGTSFFGQQATLEQAGRLSTLASAAQLRASLDRRTEEWRFQQELATQDAVIAGNQVSIANDEVGIASQEQKIAELQQSNAAAALNFLTTNFTNPDLYSWMAGVLQDVYGFFLRQATTMARLAENELSFERQQVPTGYILADYWAVLTSRKGLTGAERLLEDITQLDQFAFLTDTRKLQLSQTFSLGQLFPAEFQQFRESGVMTFSTRMELFDRSFPGHYLRLIKRIRISVIALIPPNQGICATLTNGGLSRVAIGGDIFQIVPIRRNPDSIAFTSPVNATGILDLVPQSATMLLPFENTGVDTTWEFRMEKASNFFDYSTIADVLVTIDYTALNSNDYRQQIIQSLSPTISADAAYSFRNQFADQWFDLHNPDQTSIPMTVSFSTMAEVFPPNIEDIRIHHLALRFSRANGKTFEITVSSFRFREDGTPTFVGGSATTIDGTISTRRGNAGPWIAMLGKKPFGDWELVLPNTDEMRVHFANDDIQDILFVITYSGRTAPWVN